VTKGERINCGVIHDCPLTENITQHVMHNLDLNKFEDIWNQLFADTDFSSLIKFKRFIGSMDFSDYLQRFYFRCQLLQLFLLCFTYIVTNTLILFCFWAVVRALWPFCPAHALSFSHVICML